MTLLQDKIETAHERAKRKLLAARNAAGQWAGELSSSALSTATAIFALQKHLETRPNPAISQLIQAGRQWLKANQNSDGGWGDTVLSHSNISTTALCWSALPANGAAESWLTRYAGSLEPKAIARAIIARYGRDKTFSVPILTMCALADRLGSGRDAWRFIPQLPFELAIFPHKWFQLIRLPVVSYALPALISMGLARHVNRPSINPVSRAYRAMARPGALRLLQKIQPKGGGFLEATPLTSFVVMSLIGAGLHDHPVVEAGVDFLIRSARPDGSWPIDTNLATWLTTLAVNAIDGELDANFKFQISNFILNQQYRVEHPYTHAAAGAWAWTNLPGGVPDADDTAGALIALRNLDSPMNDAINRGLGWLLDLQNRDGGVPTFCRGWGHLPFDRSGADLTGHALHAWAAWRSAADPTLQERIDQASTRAIAYLQKMQRNDGSWEPLWFGNQFVADDANYTYGTARVVSALARLGAPSVDAILTGGVDWLLAAQNPDGSWGGGQQTPPSIEETALASHALAVASSRMKDPDQAKIAAFHGIDWLIEKTDGGQNFPVAPIGFYFAKLWYFERDYPLIFTTAALVAARRLLSES